MERSSHQNCFLGKNKLIVDAESIRVSSRQVVSRKKRTTLSKTEFFLMYCLVSFAFRNILEWLLRDIEFRIVLLPVFFTF